MKTKREWNEEQDVANIVTDALENYAKENKEEDGQILDANFYGDQSSYSDNGSVQLRIGNRRFMLELHELT